MRPAPEFPTSLRIWLPLLAAAVLLWGPRAVELDRRFLASQSAQQQDESLAEGMHLLELAGWEPWRADLWQQIGIKALRGGDNDLAIRTLEKAAQLGKIENQGSLALGEAYWSQKEFAQALNAWDGLIETGQAPQMVYQRVIQFKRDAGQFDEAFQYSQAWKTAYPQDSQAAYTWDVLALATNQTVNGSMLNRAVELDPGLYVKVKPLVDALARVNSDSLAEFRLLEAGQALGSTGEWDLALAAFSTAKGINPGYAEAWAYSGAARQQLHQDGWPDLQKALELKPDSAAIQAMAGVYFRRISEFDQAVQRLSKAAELEPANAIWRMEIGNLYADQHKTQAGLTQYQKAAALEPNNAMIWQQVAEFCLYYDLELRQVGLPAARQASSLAPEAAPYADMLGRVMAALGDTASAERFLQQAIERDPDFSAAMLHLGQLYLSHGQTAQAEYYLAKAAQPKGQGTEANLIAERLLDRYFGGH